MSDTDGAGAESRPVLRIVDGDATPEEVAAIVAVLGALGGAVGGSPEARRPEWGAPHRQVRRPVAHGPGGWRASSLP